MISTRLAPTLLFCLAGLAIPLAAQDKGGADGEKFFVEKIEPILNRHCYLCHGNGKAKGGLSFYTREGLIKGGDTGTAVSLDAPATSLLLGAVRYEGLEMPPDGKLPQEAIDLLAKWVEMGAPMIPRTDVKAVHRGSPEVNDETRNHWSFRTLTRPETPKIDGPWGKSPIDAFIRQGLQNAGLQPNAMAEKQTLVRRAYYDLLGLPPSPEQVRAFVENDSPTAYSDLIDELLESPHYGEHWARYWLDLVRYAESNSFERDNPKPYVWKYRDYVIRSLNSDKPYDRFIREQLAGDELPDSSADAIIATGYYRLGPWDDEPADPMLATYDELDDIITTTAQGFLGLTLNCARCHEHKLDPIPQADYYRFLSFFKNVQRFGIRSDESVRERSVRSIASPEQQAKFEQEVRQYEDKVSSLRKRLDETESRIRETLVGGEKDDFQADSVRLGIIRKYVGKAISQAEFDDYARTRKEWTDLRNHPPQSADVALCVTEHGPEAPVTRILVRGSPAAEADPVDPAFPAVLSAPSPEIHVPTHARSTGRRLALANWIASPENPLTARVMVNRLWQWHFGRGLVRSANDFGLHGDRPTHPELLDWLASEFIAQGWSLKAMHRLLMNSQTYRMSSAGNPHNLEKDPQNNLYWRFDMRRLRAEEIRDSILQVNGSLRLDRMYGPSIYPVIPEAVLAGQSRPGENWHTSSPEERSRRSIYVHLKRSLQVPMLAAFDAPDPDSSCPVRFSTTQPTQALGMLNSDFLNEQADIFARSLRQSVGDDQSRFIEMALWRTCQRPPTNEDVRRGAALIESLKKDHGQTQAEAEKNFCLLALNLNEFMYLD